MKFLLGLHRIATNLGPICELKDCGFLGLVSSRETFIIRSQASVYIDVGERLTYEETKSVYWPKVTCDRITTDLRARDPRTPFVSLSA